MKFLVRLNHKLVNFETFSGFFFSHGYHVVQISIFCTQTGRMCNGWKFPVAKCTELALYSLVLHVQISRISGLSLKPRTIFKICSQFSENAFFFFFLRSGAPRCSHPRPAPHEKCVFTFFFFTPKTKHYQITTLRLIVPLVSFGTPWPNKQNHKTLHFQNFLNEKFNAASIKITVFKIKSHFTE